MNTRVIDHHKNWNILLFKEAIKTKEKKSIELVLKLCKIESYYIKGKILFLLLTFLKMIQLSEHNTTLTQIMTTYQKNCNQPKVKAF